MSRRESFVAFVAVLLASGSYGEDENKSLECTNEQPQLCTVTKGGGQNHSLTLNDSSGISFGTDGVIKLVPDIQKAVELNSLPPIGSIILPKTTHEAQALQKDIEFKGCDNQVLVDSTYVNKNEIPKERNIQPGGCQIVVFDGTLGGSFFSVVKNESMKAQTFKNSKPLSFGTIFVVTDPNLKNATTQ